MEREEAVRGKSGERYCCACTCGHGAVQCSRSALLLTPLGSMVSRLTDFITGLFAITVVSKLKGPAEVELIDAFLVGLSAIPGLNVKDFFVGLRRS